MRFGQCLAVAGSLLVLGLSAALVWNDGSRAAAQTTGKSKLKSGTSKAKSAAEAKELDARAVKNLENFLSEAVKLADEFEKAGKYDEASDQLKAVSRLKPDFPLLKERIENLTESMFENNDFELEHDVKESWKAHVLVFKGKPVRVESSGEYTVSFTQKSDASGLSTKDPRTDMAVGVRCGALMGLVVPLPDPGKAPGKNDKIGDPFEIGTSKEFTPKEDGVLLLNVNLPPGHKSIGKLRVRVSGHINKALPPGLRR